MKKKKKKKKTSDALEIMRRSVPAKDRKRAEQMIARASKMSGAAKLAASIKAIQKKNRAGARLAKLPIIINDWTRPKRWPMKGSMKGVGPES